MTRSRGQKARTEVPFWDISFLLALRITVVRKVWIWLEEGRTLQNTQVFSVRWTEVVGTEEEGWQVDKSCSNGTGDTGGGGRAENGQERARLEKPLI